MKLIPRDYDLVVSNRPSCQYFYPTSVGVLLISLGFELCDSKPQYLILTQVLEISMEFHSSMRHSSIYSHCLATSARRRRNSVLWQSSVATNVVGQACITSLSSPVARVNTTLFTRLSNDPSSSCSKYCVFKPTLNKFTVSPKLE